jgi:hypothetical protein
MAAFNCDRCRVRSKERAGWDSARDNGMKHSDCHNQRDKYEIQ